MSLRRLPLRRLWLRLARLPRLRLRRLWLLLVLGSLPHLLSGWQSWWTKASLVAGLICFEPAICFFFCSWFRLIRSE